MSINKLYFLATMKFGKMLKGLGKKAGGLGKRIKGAVSHAPRAGYNRAGQKGLLGGTTKSAASRALAPVKAKARAMGSKVRSTASRVANRVKGTHGADTKSKFAPRKEDFAGDFVGGQEKFADFDDIAVGGRGGGKLDFDKVFPPSGKPSKASLLKGRAQSAVNNAKSRFNKYKNSKSASAGMKSNGGTRYDPL